MISLFRWKTGQSEDAGNGLCVLVFCGGGENWESDQFHIVFCQEFSEFAVAGGPKLRRSELLHHQV